MFARPGSEEIRRVAASLGINLSEGEADSYRRAVVEQLELLDGFVQSRIDEGTPPVRYPHRELGRRPGTDEDPLHAWLWRCDIGGDDKGLLAGKTVSFKDHVAVAGVPLTFNSYALEDFIPDFDATIVTRVLEAGGRVVGKNSMDGFTGRFGLGDPISDYQRPLNPHGHAHVTGGSSSGSAVAVAASLVDIAFGGDQGGSVRAPAAWCGVIGLKPTFGLVSHFGVGFGSDQSIDHVGPIARYVEDVAAALQAVAGYDGLDPRQDRDIPKHLNPLDTLGDGIDGMRIGILAEGFAEPIQPEVPKVVAAAVKVLESAGATVSTVSVPEHAEVSQIVALYAEGAHALYRSGIFGTQARTYYPRSLVVAVNDFWAHHADLLKPSAKLQLIVAELSRRNYHGAVYAKAHNARAHFIRAYDRVLAGVDMLLMPTCISVAPEIDGVADTTDDLSRLAMHTKTKDWSALSVVQRATRNTMQFNYTGHPAITVPCGKIDGLPTAFQLVGRFLEEELLLRAAAAYQDLVDWESIVSISSQ